MKQLIFAVVAMASLAGCGNLNLKEVRISVEEGDTKGDITFTFQSLTVTHMPQMQTRWNAVCKALLHDERATFEQIRGTDDALEGTCRISDEL